MTSKKNIKNALWASILSLIACCAILIGTTYAWFTDTSSTSINLIKTGTIDIELQMKNLEGEWVTAEGQTLDFVKADDASESEVIFWEPGCTYKLQDLKLVNKSNLALKYKVVFTGINGEAKLNEAIDWTIKLDGIDLALGTEMHWLTTDNKEKEFTISGHMKEEVGNGYQGLSIEGISIAVFATQDTVEYSSVDNTYDAGASYNNTVKAGEVLTLSSNGCTVVGTNMAVGKTFMLVANSVMEHHANTEYNSLNQEILSYDIKVIDIDTNCVSESGSFAVTVMLDSNLQNVKAYHNGTLISDLIYNSETGKATFTTNSFSKFDFTWDKKNIVIVTPENIETCTYNNDYEYKFDGSFTDDVVITLPENTTIILDGTDASFSKSVLFKVGSIKFYNASQTITNKEGVYTIKNFNVENGVIAIGGFKNETIIC